jgi:hypothetical protein
MHVENLSVLKKSIEVCANAERERERERESLLFRPTYTARLLALSTHETSE